MLYYCTAVLLYLLYAVLVAVPAVQALYLLYAAVLLLYCCRLIWTQLDCCTVLYCCTEVQPPLTYACAAVLTVLLY